MDGLEDLAGGTYYIYCLSYMAMVRLPLTVQYMHNLKNI